MFFADKCPSQIGIGPIGLEKVEVYIFTTLYFNNTGLRITVYMCGFLVTCREPVIANDLIAQESIPPEDMRQQH